ncbi:MAG: response regulator transcription factor [Treponemataceae bacterium]|nr:response regulator transcription factor [Treponemataceae bacterium]
MNILLVEDEKPLALALSEILRQNKYQVETVFDGLSGYEYAICGSFDLVILDIMLPKMNGIEVLKKIREKKLSIPVLMLTAKDEIEDKVSGLDCGADDYMTKPFSTSELLARIRALSRRKGELLDEEIVYNDIVLKLKRNELVCEENVVKLSLKEFKIIEFFMKNPEQIITKERLIEKIWGDDSDAEYNNVEVYISFLRKKLQFINAKTEIRTSRGVGYLLEK